MSTLQALYGQNGQTLAITLASLASTAQRQSSVVDNSSDLFLDVLLSITMRSAGASTSTTGAVNLYAFGTVDGGSNYSEGAGASDAAITLTSPPNVRLIGIVNVVANSTNYRAGPFPIAAAFGGVMPQKWGIIAENKSGATLDGSAGNFNVTYQGVKAQSV